MATELAAYYVSIIPETSKIAPAVNKAFHKVEPQAEQSGKKSGDKFSRGFKLGLKGLDAGFQIANTAVTAFVTRAAAIGKAFMVVSKLVKGFGASTFVASIALGALAKTGLTKLASGLRFIAAIAERVAREIGQITAAFMTLMAIVKVAQFMNNFAKKLAIATVGTAALLGVVAGVSTILGGGFASGLAVAGAALAGMAAAAVALGGPAMFALKVGMKGLTDGAADFNKQFSDADEAFNKMIGQRMGPMLTAFRALRMEMVDRFSKELEPAFANVGSAIDKVRGKFGWMSVYMGQIGQDIGNAFNSPLAVGAMENIAGASGTFFQQLNKDRSGLAELTKGLLVFTSTAADAASGIGSGLNNKLAAFGESLQNTNVDQITGAFESLKQTFTNIGNVIGPVFSAFRQLGAISAPALAPGFLAIGQAVRDATPALMNMASIIMPALGQVMQNLAPLIPALIAAFTPWATSVASIAPHLASLVANLAPLAPYILMAATAAKIIGGVMFVWNVATFTASVAHGVFNAVMKRGTASIQQNTVSLIAYKAAMIAGAVATWAMNAAWAVLTSPITLIIAAIVLLIAGLVLLYKKNEGFRNFVNKAWEGIKNAVVKAWEYIKVAWDAFLQGVEWIGEKVMWLWQTVISPAFSFIGSLISSWWTGIVQPAFNGVQAAISVLGTVINWLWTNVFQPVFGFIGALISSWWSSVVEPAFNLFKAGIGVVGAVVEGLWTGIIQPVFGLIGQAISIWWTGAEIVFNLFRIGLNAVGAVISWLWDTIVSPVFGFIGDKISSVYDGIIKPKFDEFKVILGIVGDVFKDMWDKYISPAWDALKSGLDEGWKFIEKGINSGITLFEKFRDAIKKVFDFIKSGWDKVSGIFDKVGGFLGGVSDSTDRIADEGYSSGGWTGPGGKYDPAGIVHADEYVVNKAARRKFENANPGLLDYINRTGQLPNGVAGYAEGGRVSADSLVQFAKGVEGKPYVWGGVNWGDCSGAVSALANFVSGREPFGSRFGTGSQAEGLAERGFKSGKGPVGSLQVGWYNGGSAGGHTSATLPNGVNFEMGGAGGDGQYGGQAKGADYSAYTDHAYYPMEAEKPLEALEKGSYDGWSNPSSSDSGTSSSDNTSPKETREQELKDSITGNFGSAADAFVSGQIGSILDGFGLPDSPNVLKAATAWNDAWSDQATYEKEQAEWEAGQSGTSTDTAVTTTATEPSNREVLTESPVAYDPSKGASQWKPVADKALGMLGIDLANTARTIKQVGIESNGDPNAENKTDINAQNGDSSKGLLQVIGKTFTAYRSDKLPNDVLNPLANLYAGANYAQDRYGSLEKIWPTKKGYDNGGWLQPGFTLVENKTGKPEPVFNPTQWDQINTLVEAGGANRSSSGAQEHVHYHTEGINDAMRKENLRRRTNAGTYGWR